MILFFLALLFILPFIGAGFFLAFKFISDWQTGTTPIDQLAGMGVGALVFLMAGFGVAIGSIIGLRSHRRKEEVQKRYPDAPWRWRPEWRDGKVHGNTKGGVVGIWALAIFWNAISTPVLFVIPGEVSKGNYISLLFLLFPLFGILFLWAAVHTLLHYRKFGKVTFEMSTFPARLGQSLRGSVHVPVRVEFEKEIKLDLQNINIVITGSGKNRQTRHTVVWNKELRIPKHQAMVGAQKTVIPVSFEIPAEAQPTAIATSNNYHEWKLVITGEAPGVDLSLQFAVPIFGEQTDLAQVFETTDESEDSQPPEEANRF